MRDLRDWLAQAEAMGEVKHLKGVSWDLEMGVIAELVERQMDKPALLFEEVPGYPPGYRVLNNALGSRSRFAMTLGFPSTTSEMEMVHGWRRRSQETKLVPPRFTDTGPVMENATFGEEVNVLQFPTPKWHEKDGGRFLGTGDMVITQGPDGGWVNLGTYRVQVHDRTHVGLMISPTHHGRQHMEQWFAQGKPMPVAIGIGMDPLLFMVSSSELPPGVNELDYAGWVQGEPVDVIKGPITGLPIPAGAEIILEGFVDPQERWAEGPFGEFTGYYASGERLQPVVKVEGLYFRNDPIILGAPPLKPRVSRNYYRGALRAANLWDALEAAGVPDVTAVWSVEFGQRFSIVAIRQRYPGHAKQTGRIAANCYGGGGRYTVVVDEDIEVTDMDEVLWAMCTRVDPDKDIDIMRGCASSALDPIIPPERHFHPVASRVVIDATRPYEWRERFPEVVASSPELKAQVLGRWGEALRGIL